MPKPDINNSCFRRSEVSKGKPPQFDWKQVMCLVWLKRRKAQQSIGVRVTTQITFTTEQWTSNRANIKSCYSNDARSSVASICAFCQFDVLAQVCLPTVNGFWNIWVYNRSRLSMNQNFLMWLMQKDYFEKNKQKIITNTYVFI